MDTKIKQNQQQGNTAHYKPLTGPEWTKASETGSDADAVRIHRFMDAQEAKGLFNLTFFGMWEPTLRRCTCECVPKILQCIRSTLGPRHEFVIAIRKVVSLSLYVGLGSSVKATRLPPKISSESVSMALTSLNDWVGLPGVVMDMCDGFAAPSFRNRFSVFVERCGLIAIDIAKRNVEAFESAMQANGGNAALDGYFKRMATAAFEAGFNAGYERQVYLQNKSEFGTDEPAIENVPSEEGIGLIRNGLDGRPDLSRMNEPQSVWTKYDYYNRAVLYSRVGQMSKANEYLEKAAAAGCAEAQSKLGWQYMWGMSLSPKDPQKAERYLKMAVAQGHTMAMLFLGQLYEEDRPSMPKNGKLALYYYMLAAKGARIGGACQGVGRIYESGNGVPVEIEKAIAWYRRSADASNAYGVWSLRKLGVDTSCYPEYLHHLG